MATDTLYEGLLRLLRRNPAYALALPWWMVRGKAAIKDEIARRAAIDPSVLPYNPELLAFLRSARGKRRVVLCTASHMAYARAVADHLGLFDEVMATEGNINLDAPRKAERLVARFGARGFDYAGDQSSDLAVFAVARHAMAVNASLRLRRRFSTIENLARTFDMRPSHRVSATIAALGAPMWVGHLLVFAIPLATHRRVTAAAAEAFVALSACASSAWITRDLAELEQDREAGREKAPLVSGAVSIRAALILVAGLFGSAIGIAFAISKVVVAGIVGNFFLAKRWPRKGVVGAIIALALGAVIE